MSLFGSPSAELIQSIQWFNKLTNDEKTQLLTVHVDMLRGLDTPDIKQYAVLLKEISSALISKQKQEVIEKLTELGIEITFATLLVNKVVEQAPPYQLDTKTMKEVDDTIFEEIAKIVFVDVYINNSPLKKIEEKLGKNMKVFYAVRRVILQVVLFRYLRGDISIETINDILSKSYELSEKRIKIVTDLLKEHLEAIRKNFMFKNTQDALFNTQRTLITQNQIILQLKELINFLKNPSGQSSSQQPPYG